VIVPRAAAASALLWALGAACCDGGAGRGAGIRQATVVMPEPVRGPYLQSGTPTSAVVRWRTARPGDSRVSVGPSPGAFTTHFDRADVTTEHEVHLTGLLPATRYHYAVGTTAALLPADPQQFFVTPPEPGAARPVRVWAIGDSGTANQDAARVRDAYRAMTSNMTAYTDVWLMLGDNAYPSGSDASYQRAVFEMYPMFLRQTFVWPTIGNHDTGEDPHPEPGRIPFLDIFTLPAAGEAGGLPSGTERYYAFDFADVHFICLDSMTSDRGPGSPMLVWLEADLRATTRSWIIAYWHHPPYSRGNHNSDYAHELVDMRENALPILERHGVDLVLSGHSHAYERSFLLDGHYGMSGTITGAMKKDGSSGRAAQGSAYRKSAPGKAPNDGAVYVVAGSSGQVSGGSLDHPAMFISLNRLGSLVLDVDGGRVEGRFLRENGFLDDSFTLLKGPQDNALPVVQVTGPARDAPLTSTPVPVTASAGDSDGQVVKVEFFVDTFTSLGSDDSEPYQVMWHAEGGAHQLTAVATDDRGASVRSVPLTVVVPSGLGGPPRRLPNAGLQGPEGRSGIMWYDAGAEPVGERPSWRTRRLPPGSEPGCTLASAAGPPALGAIALLVLGALARRRRSRRRGRGRP
jgi:MYXO-CTERM domain-containing protein